MDETGIQTIPAPRKTLAPKGSKSVPGTAKKAILQITKVNACTYAGDLLPPMLIFNGKTPQVLPTRVAKIPGSVFTCTPTHFANSSTTLKWVTDILVPFIKSNRRRRVDGKNRTAETEESRWAVLVWDNFSPHLDAEVTRTLLANHIKPFPLPPRCTSKAQPLDVNFNGPEKRHLTQCFIRWHRERFSELYQPGCLPPDVLPKTAAGKRALIALLVLQVHMIMQGLAHMIRKAWRLAGYVFYLEMEVDEVPASVDDREYDNVVQAMRDLAVAMDEKDDLPQVTVPVVLAAVDAPDSGEHGNVVEFVCDEEDIFQPIDEPDHHAMQVDEDESSDADYEPSLASSSNSGNDTMSAISGESCQVLNISRAPEQGWLNVHYESSERLPPQELVQQLKTQFKDLRRLELVDTRRIDDSNIQIRIANTDRASVLHAASTFVYNVKTSPY